MVKAQVQFLAALVMGVLATTTACSSDSAPADEATDSANPTDSASSLLVAPEDIEDFSAAAVAAYERYWRAVADATAIPDPSHEALAQAASGSALETAQGIVTDAVDAGKHGSGQPSHSPAVTESYPVDAPTRFVVSDCMDTADWLLLNDETGEQVQGEEYGTHQVDALVEQVDGQWLVTEVVILELGSCLRGAVDDSGSSPP
jgi:hypothetical protein